MTRLYAVFSSHALLPFPFRGSSLSARISEVRRRFSNNLHNFCCAQFLPPMRRTGAMPVTLCMPCGKDRWSDHAFGVLAECNTCRFLYPTALRTQHQWSTWSIALGRLTCPIAKNLRMTARTFPTGIARTHPTGDDPRIPSLVFGVLENASLHPVRSFHVAPMAILARARFEVAQMLKN